MTNGPEMPATVAAYLRAPAVRSAVDALLTVKADTLPPGLEWHELGTYYRARGGAELTRHDMAHFLHLLWKTIWGAVISTDWQAAPLDEIVDYEYAITPQTIWSDSSCAVYHYRKPYVLYTKVGLKPHELVIAFDVEDEEAEASLIDGNAPPFRLRDDGAWSGWQVFETELAVRGELPDLGAVRSAAAKAAAAADLAVSARRAAR